MKKIYIEDFLTQYMDDNKECDVKEIVEIYWDKNAPDDTNKVSIEDMRKICSTIYGVFNKEFNNFLEQNNIPKHTDKKEE